MQLAHEFLETSESLLFGPLLQTQGHPGNTEECGKKGVAFVIVDRDIAEAPAAHSVLGCTPFRTLGSAM